MKRRRWLLGGYLTCEDVEDVAEAEAAIAAEEAAEQARLARLGYPKPGRCLRCGRRRTITEPTDRLCGTCKQANAGFDVDHRWSHLGGYDDDPYVPRW